MSKGRQAWLLILLAVGAMALLPGSFTRAQNHGQYMTYSNGAWGLNVPALDCSQFAGADASLKIQACLVALHALNAQGGIADARALGGAQTFSVNPFAAASLPAGGELLLGGGTYTTNIPVVMPDSWEIVGTGSRPTNNGTEIIAGASFHAWANPDAGTITTVSAAGQGATVTGSGTGFASSMVGCAFVTGTGITTGTVSAYGIITAVASATGLTLGYNGGGAVSSGTLPYAIYCPVVAMGNGNVASGEQFGIQLHNLDIECNGVAGCVDVMDWYAEEWSKFDNVSLGGSCNIGFDRETPYSQNSGPFTNFTFSLSSCTAASALAVVDRVSGGASSRPFMSGDIIGASHGQTGVDEETPLARWGPGIHSEGLTTAIDINDSVACPVACPSGHLYARGVSVAGLSLGGAAGTTGVNISSNNTGEPPNVTVSGIYNSGWTNDLTDSHNGCTETSTQLGYYALDTSGALKYSTSTIAGCISFQPLSSVSGSASQATGTESAAGDNYTFAGVETSALTAPFVFTNANSANSNPSSALIIGTTGTSTGAVPLVINEGTAAGDLLDMYNGGTVTNGTISGGTKEFFVTKTGLLSTAGNIQLGGGTISASVNTGTVTYQGGSDVSSSNGLGQGTFRGADQTGAGGASSSGGNFLGRGGNNAGTNAGSNAGSAELSTGKSTGATPGLQGLMALVQSYAQTGTVTQWNVECHTSTAMSVTDCGTSSSNIAGIAEVTSGTVQVSVLVTPSESPVNATAAVTIGDTVCTSTSTAGKVTDSGGTGACSTGTLVGTVIATSGSFPNFPDGTAFPTLSTTLPLIRMRAP